LAGCGSLRVSAMIGLTQDEADRRRRARRFIMDRDYTWSAEDYLDVDATRVKLAAAKQTVVDLDHLEAVRRFAAAIEGARL
jgi:hypothetical protein